MLHAGCRQVWFYSTWLLILRPRLEKQPLCKTCHPCGPGRQYYHNCSTMIVQRKSHDQLPYQWDEEEYPLMGGNCRVKMYNILTRKKEQIIGEIIKSTTLVKNRIIWRICFSLLILTKQENKQRNLKSPLKIWKEEKRDGGNRLCVWFPFALDCFVFPLLPWLCLKCNMSYEIREKNVPH